MNSRNIETIVSDGTDFIPRLYAVNTLWRFGAKSIEFCEDGELQWIDVWTGRQRYAVPYLVNGAGWCYLLSDLRDGAGAKSEVAQ